jgi:iron(III) transport system substrate-binding protein
MKSIFSIKGILAFFSVLSLITLAMTTVGMAIEVSSYSTNDKVMMDPACELIKKATGITVSNLSMGGGEQWTRMMSEKPNIQADMSIGVNIDQAIKLKAMNLLISYKSKTWEIVPAEFKDKDGHYYCDSMWTVMPVVNTDLIKKKGLRIPKSWYDLIDPVWKGEIAMPNPLTSSSAYLTLCGLVRLMGEDQAFAYLEKLHKNVSQYTKSGGAPALLVARGEVAFGITDSTSTYAYIKEGYPILPAIPKEGVGYSLSANCIFTSTKDPARLEASKKVLDYTGTKEYQDFIGKYRPKVTNPEAIGLEKEYGKIVLLKDFDFEWVGNNVKRLQDRWKATFQK